MGSQRSLINGTCAELNILYGFSYQSHALGGNRVTSLPPALFCVLHSAFVMPPAVQLATACM